MIQLLAFIFLQTPPPKPLFGDMLETLVYSIIGLLIAILAFKVIDWLTPGKMSKQIAEEGNVALAIVVAGLMIGISIIIAAAIS